MSQEAIPLDLDYKPRFPADYRPGVGIIGCGNIVKSAHLRAYNQYGVRVVGVYDVSPEATRGVREQFGVEHVFDSLEALLSHPEIEVVDIATHPPQRVPLMLKALEAGKHILAQKPLAPTVREAQHVVEEATRRGLKVAVNQNGRWAPPWRIATLLIERGYLGEILAITHLYDVKFDWFASTPFDRIEHAILYDYSIHWFDITRCWMGEEPILAVRAREYRPPNQPAEARAPWGLWVEIAYANGASAVIRNIGGSETRRKEHLFWIHGTQGVIRGSVLGAELGSDFVELEKAGTFCRYMLEGHWYPDGFAGTMGELFCAIAEDREPYNSARHNLLSLRMTLAACRSAEEDGRPVTLEEVT